MGLPLAAQFASHGWRVTAVDVQQSVVDSINAGESHVGEEPGLAELVRTAHTGGPPHGDDRRRCRCGSLGRRRPDRPGHARRRTAPDYRYMDAAVESIGPGSTGSVVIFETTLPVGDTRGRFAPRLEAISGLRADEDFFVAFSPERLYSGAALRNLATYPKLVGGIGAASTARAAAFYDAVLDTEIVAMSNAEAAEFSKLADTTYRDVNIALANEFARYAERAASTSTRSSPRPTASRTRISTSPGIGVGGHCIPVYPHFMLARAPELEMVALARRTNDGQVGAGDQGAPAGARRAGWRADPRPRADLPPRRQGAGVLAGAAADRAPDPPGRGRLRLRSAAHRGRDPRLLRDRVEWGTRAVPGDRDPDRRPAVRDARPRHGSRTLQSCSTGGTGCATWRCRRAWPTRDRRAGREATGGARPPDVRLVSIVGTRPQLIKAAALLPAIRARHDEVFIDTGQHWDEDGRLVLLGARPARPDHSSGSAAVARRSRPRGCSRPSSRSSSRIGRTRSCLRRHELDAGRRARRREGRHPVAHVEAGLRSFDRTMPEEVNRVVADHLSRWLFAPTPTAIANLAAEGVTDGVLLVGDVLQDLAARTAGEVADPAVLAGIEAGLRGDAPGLHLGPASTCSRRSIGLRTATRSRCEAGLTSSARSPDPSGR